MFSLIVYRILTCLSTLAGFAVSNITQKILLTPILLKDSFAVSLERRRAERKFATTLSTKTTKWTKVTQRIPAETLP